MAQPTYSALLLNPQIYFLGNKQAFQRYTIYCPKAVKVADRISDIRKHLYCLGQIREGS